MKKNKRIMLITLPAIFCVGVFVGILFAEVQPQMKAALASLRQAKQHLDKATADKAGHRAKALNLIGQAISEVEQGIAADNKK